MRQTSRQLTTWSQSNESSLCYEDTRYQSTVLTGYVSYKPSSTYDIHDLSNTRAHYTIIFSLRDPNSRLCKSGVVEYELLDQDGRRKILVLVWL